MGNKKKKNVLFEKIENRDDAILSINDSAIAFFSIAILQGALGYFFSVGMFLDGIAYAILSAILLKWKSRVAAILLLLLTCSTLVTTTLNEFVAPSGEIRYLPLTIILFYIAIRSVEATFKLHGKFATENA